MIIKLTFSEYVRQTRARLKPGMVSTACAASSLSWQRFCHYTASLSSLWPLHNTTLILHTCVHTIHSCYVRTINTTPLHMLVKRASTANQQYSTMLRLILLLQSTVLAVNRVKYLIQNRHSSQPIISNSVKHQPFAAT